MLLQPVRIFDRLHLDFYDEVQDDLQVRFLDTFVHLVLLGANLRDSGLSSDTQNGIVIYRDGLFEIIH